MNIKPLSDVLHPLGLTAIPLRALIPNTDNYEALFMQPHGDIVASADGVFNRDKASALSQFGAFLHAAAERGSNLAVTPEYSLPWKALIDSLKKGETPAQGDLWALGCESVKPAELATIAGELADIAAVIHEPVAEGSAKFLDPLAYVFWATNNAGDAQLLVVIQFKTASMGDPEHFEVNNLERGTCIYQLGGGAEARLFGLICSDAFGVTDAHAAAMYDRALILHIQLNPKPRHAQYRLYRDKLLGYHGDVTELICLNWAANVCDWSDGEERSWQNFSASAWYLRPQQFDCCDKRLRDDHRRGLYYTWLRHLRYHVMFFDPAPRVFALTASKVFHLNVAAPLSYRRGPRLTAAFQWDAPGGNWVEEPTADDGFQVVIGHAGPARPHIEALCADNPLYVERLLALSAGRISSTEDWHRIQNVDSCAIDPSEVIQRMTFCKDEDESANRFRCGRLKLCGRLTTVLTSPDNLPAALKDMQHGFKLRWSPEAPHQNALAQNGEATVVYMGEQATLSEVESVKKRLAEFLQRHHTADAGLAAKQRLAVWHQEEGEIRLYRPHQYISIDKPDKESEFDIGRDAT